MDDACRIFCEFQNRKSDSFPFRYSGYCPQYRFSCGETYAKATHKLLLDPTINHATTLVLANRAIDYEVNDLQHLR